jgi:hypothetical protein
MSMSRKPQNFRELLDSVRFNRPEEEPPIPWSTIASRLSISKDHLFSLMSGRRSAPDWTITKIANRLGRSKAEVRAALDQTKAEV